MSAARKRSLAVFLVLVVFLFLGGSPAYSQSPPIPNLHTTSTAALRVTSSAWPAICPSLSSRKLAEERASDGFDWPVPGNATPVDFYLPRASETLCLESVLPVPPRPDADNPCLETAARPPGIPDVLSCKDAADTVLPELSTFGKAGAKIARAREQVLAILRADNACTEWFVTKDATPAATFQSLSFIIDKRGQEDVLETAQPDSMFLWRQPYVASATQDGGAHTAITINAHGAFYRQQGNVLRLFPGGGPVRADGARLLTVGSYTGDTLPAQMVTLLHELGHIIDLLPADADNLDGKSVRNTDEVLRHCRAEVEARSELAKQTAKR